MRRRKPDTFILLAMLIGLGVLATGFMQGVIGEASAQSTVGAPK